MVVVVVSFLSMPMSEGKDPRAREGSVDAKSNHPSKCSAGLSFFSFRSKDISGGLGFYISAVTFASPKSANLVLCFLVDQGLVCL